MIAYLYLHIQTRALERMLRCPEERSSFPGRQENIEPEHFAKRSETHPGEHECFFFWSSVDSESTGLFEGVGDNCLG